MIMVHWLAFLSRDGRSPENQCCCCRKNRTIDWTSYRSVCQPAWQRAVAPPTPEQQAARYHADRKAAWNRRQRLA